MICSFLRWLPGINDYFDDVTDSMENFAEMIQAVQQQLLMDWAIEEEYT